MAKVCFKENDDLVDIRYDNVFKAVFTRENPVSRRALSRLISALINREVSVKSINANEPPIDNLRDRQIRYDINCRAKTGELVNVEMAFDPDKFEPVRLEFYAGKLFTGQDIRGTKKNYKDLKEAYQITILAKERFFPDEFFLHSFEYFDPVHNIPLKGKSRIIAMELSKAEMVVEKPTHDMSVQEHWAVFFRYLTDTSKRRKINEIVEREEGVAMASREVIRISKDERERARLMSEYKYQLDMQSKIVTARREAKEERIKAREEGRQEGRQEGRHEGREEGREEGRTKEREDIARKLKAMGMSADQIEAATGLRL